MKISSEQLQLISLFEQLSSVQAFDALLNEDSVVFVVKSGDLGKAIGKNGSTLARLERAMGRRVELVEFADNLEGFLRNLFKPAKLEHVQVNNAGQSVLLRVEAQNKGLAIGRGGSRINRARELAKRHFGVVELKVT
ncbi:MAG: NusA-like transcription termination signal-binding factor [Candidatus Norongarragalinales archaeon]